MAGRASNWRSLARVGGYGRRRIALTVVVCAIIVALFAAIAVFANTAIGYLPVIAVVTLLAMGFAYLAVLKRSLTFEEQGPSSGSVRGDVLDFALKIENRSILPAPRIDALFMISDESGEAIRAQERRVSLPPRSNKVFDLGARFDHIGHFHVGISSVILHDLFGVFFSGRGNDALHPVSILPRLVDIGSFDLSEQSYEESSKNIKTFINDGMDYSGIREYHWGDPIKSIHWKLSSKTVDNYFTRLYETPSSPGVAIFIDFECNVENGEAAMGVYDALVESALSIEDYASFCGFDTRLLFVNEIGETCDAAGPLGNHFDELLRRFPNMHAGNGGEVIQLIRQISSSVNCPSNLVVCSGNANEELSNLMASLSGPSRAPYMVAVYSDEESQKRMIGQARRLEDARVHSSVIRNASDLNIGGV